MPIMSEAYKNSGPQCYINIVAADLEKLDFLDKKAFEASMC